MSPRVEAQFVHVCQAGCRPIEQGDIVLRALTLCSAEHLVPMAPTIGLAASGKMAAQPEPTQSSDILASLPGPVIRLLVIFSRPVAWLRVCMEILLWKPGRRVESWLVVASWWALCLGFSYSFRSVRLPTSLRVAHEYKRSVAEADGTGIYYHHCSSCRFCQCQRYTSHGRRGRRGPRLPHCPSPARRRPSCTHSRNCMPSTA